MYKTLMYFYITKMVKPSEILSQLFIAENVASVINEDGYNDWNEILLYNFP